MSEVPSSQKTITAAYTLLVHTTSHPHMIQYHQQGA